MTKAQQSQPSMDRPWAFAVLLRETLLLLLLSISVLLRDQTKLASLELEEAESRQREEAHLLHQGLLALAWLVALACPTRSGWTVGSPARHLVL